MNFKDQIAQRIGLWDPKRGDLRRDARVFYGVRAMGECKVTIATHGFSRPLPLHDKAVNHSPTGFEWGYAGSGPSQLAFAMLAELIGESKAMRIYQNFKRAYVQELPHEVWRLDAETILEWVRKNEGVSE